uniref:Uncharacterized protein n=1 Tax=Medicago truncatula TaxID=3880 RepID=I3S909_MEDTR|nr:unknown [Medicago truncatula]
MIWFPFNFVKKLCPSNLGKSQVLGFHLYLRYSLSTRPYFKQSYSKRI